MKTIEAVRLRARELHPAQSGYGPNPALRLRPRPDGSLDAGSPAPKEPGHCIEGNFPFIGDLTPGERGK